MTDATAPQPMDAPAPDPDHADTTDTATDAMPSAREGKAEVDPHGLGAAIAKLSTESQDEGFAAFAVLSAFLADGERVDVLVQGRFQGESAAMAATNQRVLIANARQWRADVVEFVFGPTLQVQGWQDDQTAALVVQDDHFTATFDQILDRTTAQQLAAVVRARAESLAP